MPAPLTEGQSGKETVTELTPLVVQTGRGTIRHERRVRVRRRVRIGDDIVRVEAIDTTEAKARTKLNAKIAERIALEAERRRGSNKIVSDYLDQWVADLDGRDIARSSAQTYRLNAERSISGSKLAKTRIADVTVGGVHNHLQGVANSRGMAEAKTTRSILRGVFDIAILEDALDRNPARDVPRLRKPNAEELAAAKLARRATASASRAAEVVQDEKASKSPRTPRPKDTDRAFQPEDLPKILDAVDASEYARRNNLPVLVHVLAATGMRIGEACALTWSDVDFVHGTINVHGTAQRVTGEGMHVQGNTKTTAGMRRISVAPTLIEYLREHKRTHLPKSAIVCASGVGTLRDPSNSTKQLRVALTAAGYDWATAHTFRRTVATLLDEQGVSAREIASYLGHRNPSMTTDVYMDARRNAATAGLRLDAIFTTTKEH